MVVVPPQAADRDPLKKSSAISAPSGRRCSRWMWPSMPPGVTVRPAASTSSRPPSRDDAMAAIFPDAMPMSAEKTSAGVATVAVADYQVEVGHDVKASHLSWGEPLQGP